MVDAVWMAYGINLIWSVILYQERPKRRVRLSGYGVELQIKSTEYKVQDDTEVKGDRTQDSYEQEDEDDEIEGFNFSRLK
jgi:UDP-glucose:glycoprotein glucosyltransferase